MITTLTALLHLLCLLALPSSVTTCAPFSNDLNYFDLRCRISEGAEAPGVIFLRTNRRAEKVFASIAVEGTDFDRVFLFLNGDCVLSLERAALESKGGDVLLYQVPGEFDLPFSHAAAVAIDAAGQTMATGQAFNSRLCTAPEEAVAVVFPRNGSAFHSTSPVPMVLRFNPEKLARDDIIRVRSGDRVLMELPTSQVSKLLQSQTPGDPIGPPCIVDQLSVWDMGLGAWWELTVEAVDGEGVVMVDHTRWLEMVPSPQKTLDFWTQFLGESKGCPTQSLDCPTVRTSDAGEYEHLVRMELRQQIFWGWQALDEGLKGLMEGRTAASELGSCAIVGSSGHLLGKGLGSVIDAHDAVIRIGAAPTAGFELDVGHGNTTLRWLVGDKLHVVADLDVAVLSQNSFGLDQDLSPLFGSNHPRFPAIVLATLPTKALRTARHLQQFLTLRGVRGKVLVVGDHVRAAAHQLLDLARSEYEAMRRLTQQRPDTTQFPGTKYPTSGLNAIVFAGLTCSRVDVYGFYPGRACEPGVPYRYYDQHSADCWTHTWGSEETLLDLLHAAGVINLVQ